MGRTGHRDHHGAAGRRLLAVWAVVIACATGPALVQSTLAQEANKILGAEIGPPSGPYLVLKGVNVRAKPVSGGKRVSKLKKGSRVEVLGKVKGAPWMAVAKDGKAHGFVYAPMLMPLIDGALKKDLAGRAPGGPGPACDYTIRFEGKSSVEGDLFKTADYDVNFACSYKGKDITFTAFMFITEAPYQMSAKNPVYQFSIDLREVGESFDQNFTTNLLYHRNTGKLVFDDIPLKHYARSPPVKKTAVASVPEALVTAVRMALGAWNDKVWQELAERGSG